MWIHLLDPKQSSASLRVFLQEGRTDLLELLNRVEAATSPGVPVLCSPAGVLASRTRCDGRRGVVAEGRPGGSLSGDRTHEADGWPGVLLPMFFQTFF